jgi:hypothetical protein
MPQFFSLYPREPLLCPLVDFSKTFFFFARSLKEVSMEENFLIILDKIAATGDSGPH